MLFWLRKKITPPPRYSEIGIKVWHMLNQLSPVVTTDRFSTIRFPEFGFQLWLCGNELRLCNDKDSGMRFGGLTEDDEKRLKAKVIELTEAAKRRLEAKNAIETDKWIKTSLASLPDVN
jgi:hypothetical protein